MGNTNSSPRYRSRSPDPSSLEQTWNNSYPKVERERNRSARQQHAQQNQSKHLTGYPSPVSGGNVMVNGHLNANAHYDQFEQECIQQQQQQQQQPKMPDQQPLRFARYGPGVGEAPVQQAKKIRVLPMAANGAAGNAGVNAVKLRATDNGLALQKVGTLHVANRKLTELNHNLMAANCESPIIPTLVANGADEMRSPTPDYDPNNKQRSSSGSRKPSKSKRNSKAKAANTAPSTPAASAKSGSSSRVDQEQQPAGGSKSSGRAKLRLFKTKSTDGKAADSENGRIRARSMEYLRADVADETQEVRRGGRHNTSREDLSGDESLLAFIRNGPVTVFSSQKKLNGTMTDDDDWEEMHPSSSSFSRVPLQSEQPASSSSNNNNNNNNSKPQQFYFGMAPGDQVASPAGPAAVPAALSVDLDEESRRVMEEFDAVLAENKSGIDRKSESEEKEDVRLRQSIRRPAKSTSSSGSSDQRRRHSSTPPPVIRHHSSTRRATLHEDQLDHDDDYDQDIALSLRPTLPKKPQQLPRFSPSAAWRALGQPSDHFHAPSSSISSVSNKLNASSSKASDMSAMDLSDEEDEDEDVMEERIAKNALRPVAPHPPRISNEKSADSGISGDAGSPDGAAAMVVSGGGASGRDKPLAMSSPVPPQQQRNPLQNNWTPQQDLLDDDSSNNGSSDGEAVSNHVQRRSRSGSSCFRASKRHPSTADPTPPKIIPKSQMFSDSSMTDPTADSRSSSMSKGGRKYRKRNETGDEGAAAAGAHCIPHKYNSLRKLKRSVSGAFATAFRRSKCSPSDDDCDNDEECNVRRSGHHAPGPHCDDGNWMLSRSAPNSVLNGSGGDDDGSYPSIRKLQSRSEADLLAQQNHGFAQLGHQYPAYSQPSVLSTQRIVYLPQYDSRIVSAHQRQPRLSRPLSMDQTDMMRRARSADAVFLEAKKQSVGQRLFGNGHSPNKKFTFQSTVRVHEKRLLEEKLSREAEQKERKRLQETLAMQRVEEEFQRKRAREKANIRQQLRVLQLDHYKHQEQLMVLRQQQHHQQQRIARLDPEGAPSSISHHRTSSDELPIQQQPMAVKKSANARSAEAEARDKRKESTPPAATSSSALQQLRNNRSASHNIRSDDVVDSPKRKTQQQQQPQMDYRREVINSSRSRSAATPSTQSGNPAAIAPEAGRFPDHQTRINNNADRNLNNNNNNNSAAVAAVVVQQKKKSNSNIYRRLAEITSEEESISSPPPVSSLMARSSNNSCVMNKQQQQQSAAVAPAAHSRGPSSAAAVQHVVSNTNGNPSSSGNKVMTQELSEYRQERREYHDFRSPRLHQQQLISSSGRFYGAGQPSGHRVLPTSAASSSTSSISNKMQSDNYRWDFAHGGRGGHHMAAHPSAQPSVMKSTPTPPSVATWHHHHQAQLLQQKPQVFSSRQQHDYHHHHQFYKMASPTTDAVMMHRTPQQRHH